MGDKKYVLSLDVNNPYLRDQVTQELGRTFSLSNRADTARHVAADLVNGALHSVDPVVSEPDLPGNDVRLFELNPILEIGMKTLRSFDRRFPNPDIVIEDALTSFDGTDMLQVDTDVTPTIYFNPGQHRRLRG